MEDNKEIIKIAQALKKHSFAFEAYVRAVGDKDAVGKIEIDKDMISFTVVIYNKFFLKISNGKVIADTTSFSPKQVADILNAVRDGSYMFVEGDSDEKTN